MEHRDFDLIPPEELAHACAVRSAQLIMYRDDIFQKMMSMNEDIPEKEKDKIIRNYNDVTVRLSLYDKLFMYDGQWISKIWNYINRDDDDFKIRGGDYVSPNPPLFTDPCFSSKERMKEWVTRAEDIKE